MSIINNVNSSEVLELFTDPVKWCESFLRNPNDKDLPLELRSYQREIIEQTRNHRRIILRYGRRMGKSITMCADTLWWCSAYPIVRMIEEGRKRQLPFTVIIATPYETQIKELWNVYSSLIADSPLLREQIVRIRTSDVHTIEFDNGSIIKGYTIGISSSNRGTSLRSLSADMVFLDEMDFIPREIIEQVVMPIWTTHTKCQLRICSTPSGKRELFYDWCWPQVVDITTDTGIKKISDVKIGDYVFGEDGYFEKVITTYKQPFKGKLVEFSTGISETVSCTPNHEIFVYGNGFTRAEEITIGDYILVPKEKYSFKEIKIDPTQYYFEKELTRIDRFDKAQSYKNYADAAEDLFGSRQMRRQLFKYRNDKKKYGELWPFDNRKRKNIIKAQKFLDTIHLLDQRKFYKFLGYYLAEGNILKDFSSDNHYYSGIQLTFSSKEHEYIEECISIISEIFPDATIKTTFEREDNSTSILIYSSWISYIFIELCGEYSHKKRLHNYIMAMITSDKTFCDIQDLGNLLLEGYINGDGFKLQSGKYSFVSTSKELAKQLLSISLNIGIPSTFHTSIKKDKHTVYTIYQLVDNSYKIKYDKTGKLYIRVDTISRKSYDDYVYNLETEYTHTYNVQNLCTHNCTKAEELGWLHRHYPSWHPDNTNWMSIAQAKEQGLPITESTEYQVRAITSSSNYEREYGAEFGEEFGGVYKSHLIDKSMKKYGRNINISDPDIFDPGFEQKASNLYIIGVDWNSYINGGQVVMLEFCREPTIERFFDDELGLDVEVNFTGKYRLFYRRGISSKEATQRRTREEVIRLMRTKKVDFVYVDYGAGDTNIEELTLYGRDHPILGMNRKLKVVDSGASVDHWDPILNKLVKKRNKSLMVNFSALNLEEGMYILPKEEDELTRLVGQMRGYQVKHVTSRGDFTYEGEDHILDAFNLAVYGFQKEYGEILNNRISHKILFLNDPRFRDYPIRNQEFDGGVIPTAKKSMKIIDPEKIVQRVAAPVRISMPQQRKNLNFRTRGSF